MAATAAKVWTPEKASAFSCSPRLFINDESRENGRQIGAAGCQQNGEDKNRQAFLRNQQKGGDAGCRQEIGGAERLEFGYGPQPRHQRDDQQDVEQAGDDRRQRHAGFIEQELLLEENHRENAERQRIARKNVNQGEERLLPGTPEQRQRAQITAQPLQDGYVLMAENQFLAGFGFADKQVADHKHGHHAKVAQNKEKAHGWDNLVAIEQQGCQRR